MKEQTKAFWLGIFIIAALAIAAWLLLFLRPSIGDGEKTLRVRFSNIERVNVGTRVTFAGKPVGEVVEINEIFDARTKPTGERGEIYVYELVMEVDSGVEVYSYDDIIFSTSGLLGEKTIAIIPKAAPSGEPPSQPVTDEVLYARSTDTVQEALGRLSNLADSFEGTMESVNELITDNKEEINQAFTSFTSASQQMDQVFARINETDFIGSADKAAEELERAMARTGVVLDQAIDLNLVQTMSDSLSHIHSVAQKINNNEGTLGRLISDDGLYLQFTGTMSKLDTLLHDINSYGLLFQYDKTWQRTRRRRQEQIASLCTPCDVYNAMNDQLCEISVALGRLHEVLGTMECCEMEITDECIAERFRELLSKIESLEETLKLYTQSLDWNCCP